MQADLHGILPVHKGEFELLQKSALRWSNRLKQAVAVCNSLSMVSKNTVAGVDMERAMFKAVEAHFLVSSSSFDIVHTAFCDAACNHHVFLCALACSLTYSLTHLPTHSLTHPPVHPPTRSLTRSLTYSLTHSLNL